jgi:hypothetical protein
LGFRVRSGRAVAVLLGGDARRRRVLDLAVVSLMGESIPESMQPYHAALVAHRLANPAAAERLVRVVERAAAREVADLLGRYREAGHAVASATLVVGSLVDPATIGNEHMRAHALEGKLFRTVLEEALAANGVDCALLLEKEAYALASTALRLSVDHLKRAVTALRPASAPSWRADEKLAALAAWAAMSAARRRS